MEPSPVIVVVVVVVVVLASFVSPPRTIQRYLRCVASTAIDFMITVNDHAYHASSILGNGER